MINVDELLEPISDEKICGDFLKYEKIYDDIQEYRREDDPRLPQGIWQTEIKRADWPKLINTCVDALKNKTKDLQLAAWLLEALTVTEGFAGLGCGIQLFRKMSEKFWDEVYPEIDSEGAGLMRRMAPIYFFSEKIRDRIILIPLSAPTDYESDSYSLADWLTARHHMHVKNLPKDSLTMEQIKKSVSMTPESFYLNVKVETENALNELKLFEDFLNEKCHDDSPSFRSVYECLQDVQQTAINCLGECLIIKPVKENPPEEEQKIQKPTPESPKDAEKKVEEAPQPASTGEKKTKKGPTIENAYKVLRDIGNFLAQAQPQSPSATLIKIALALGEKSFQELLEINMKNGVSVMNTISELHLAVNGRDANPISFDPTAPQG